MSIELTEEQRQALEREHGFLQGPSFVLMSLEVYRETMGVESDEELAASLKAIEEGIADIQAGRTVPLEKVFDDLDRKYGVPD